MSLSRKSRSMPVQSGTFAWLKPQTVIGAMGILIALVYSLLGYTETMVPVCVVAIIGLTIVQIAGSRNSVYLLLLALLIAYVNYSIIVYFYLASPPSSSNYLAYVGTQYANIAIGILLLFLSIMTLFFPRGGEGSISIRAIFTRSTNFNALIVLAVCAVLTYILIFGYTPGEALGERGQTSTVYESATIFLLIGFYFSGDRRGAQLIMQAFAVVLALEGLLFADRIAPMQFLLCMYVVYYIDRLPQSFTVCLLIGGILMLGFIGEDRVVDSSYSFSHFIDTWLDRKGAQSTFPGAYHASISFVAFKDITSIPQQLSLFWDFIVSQVIGTKQIETGSLAAVTREYYWHNYGGIYPFFFYYYLGIIGVVFGSFLPGLYVRVVAKMEASTNPIIVVLSVFFLVTVFRWYVYSPTTLLRTAGQLAVLFGAAYLVHGMYQKSKQGRSRVNDASKKCRQKGQSRYS